jgi:hypothetical protein
MIFLYIYLNGGCRKDCYTEGHREEAQRTTEVKAEGNYSR